MFGGSALAHHAHDFALQAGDVLDFRAPVERKPIGGNSHRDGDQIATGQNCVDYRAADARKIDVPGDHRLVHSRCPGNKNILHRHAVFLIELGFADKPERQHRPARLWVADARWRIGREEPGLSVSVSENIASRPAKAKQSNVSRTSNVISDCLESICGWPGLSYGRKRHTLRTEDRIR